jgi:hypothetical protein
MILLPVINSGSRISGKISQPQDESRVENDSSCFLEIMKTGKIQPNSERTLPVPLDISSAKLDDNHIKVLFESHQQFTDEKITSLDEIHEVINLDSAMIQSDDESQAQNQTEEVINLDSAVVKSDDELQSNEISTHHSPFMDDNIHIPQMHNHQSNSLELNTITPPTPFSSPNFGSDKAEDNLADKAQYDPSELSHPTENQIAQTNDTASLEILSQNLWLLQQSKQPIEKNKSTDSDFWVSDEVDPNYILSNEVISNQSFSNVTNFTKDRSLIHPESIALEEKQAINDPVFWEKIDNISRHQSDETMTIQPENISEKMVESIATEIKDGHIEEISGISPFAKNIMLDLQESYHIRNSARIEKNIIELPEQIKIELTQAIEKGDSKITIALSPIELGKVDIEIKITDNLIESIDIHAGKIETLELLQADVKQIEKIIQEITKSDETSLSFNLRDDSQNRQSKHQQDHEIIPLEQATNFKQVSLNYINGHVNYSKTGGLDIII